MNLKILKQKNNKMELDIFEQVNQNGDENNDVICSICYENMN